MAVGLRQLRGMLALVCACAAQAGEPTAPHDLGRVVYIGDSLTHGVGAASYRWPLHKILVDNGVRFEVLGIVQGNRYADMGVAPGTSYRGVAFNNRHCAVTSERAYEVSGREHPSERLGASDIHDWLGQDATYSGAYRLAAAPDTCFILLGTNDMLGDYDGSFDRPENLLKLKRALLDEEQGDMSVILSALRRANPSVRVIVLSIPTWEYHVKNNSARAYAAVREYNAALAEWARKKGVIFVDAFEPLVDVSCEDMPGKGVPDFFFAEENMHLHPSAQGDLLIAGRVARALGYHGRTAGLPLPRAKAPRLSCTLAPGESYAEPLAAEAADITLRAAVGDGARGGWETQRGLRISFAHEKSVGGSLTVTESAVIWGDGAVLCSADMSGGREPLRIAWVEGNAAQGIPAGYYVWRGGQLIGEALPPVPGIAPGLRLHNDLQSNAELQLY